MPASIISVTQMREWESASWAAGVSQSAVIANVGKIIVAKIRESSSPKDTVLLLAGKGHNGDDVCAATQFLQGINFTICNVVSIGEDLTTALAALEKKPDVIVDGLFGIGLSRPLDASWRTLINAINHAGAKIISVDVPSGLNADTGEPMGDAVKASITLTLGAIKPGLLKTVARPYVGKLELAEDIGLVKKTFASELQWTLSGDFKKFPPPRNAFSYKGTYGHLGIVAGSEGYHGAAVLCASAAQRAAPGLVSLVTMPGVYVPVASQLQAVMVDAWRDEGVSSEKFDALLVGPGLAAKSVPGSLRQWTRDAWIQFKGPMVVDASALDWLKDIPTPKSAEAGERFVTPHPGEAARILGKSVSEVESDRVASLRAVSAKLNDCWVVLKGAQSLIGRSNGLVTINSSGNPHLAQGGSGDVLAGYLAGLLAQKELQKDCFKTFGYAVWQHGATADALSKRKPNWIIEELATEIGSVVVN